MAEVQAAIDDASRHLKGTDNDSKVSALQALERKLSSSSSAEDVDSTQLEPIISLLKLSLRNGNSHVYAAGVSCSVALFKTIDEHWHILKQNNQSTAHIDAILKNAVHTLALPPGGLITFLGDAKDSVRAAARVALVQAAISSAAVLASDSRLPPDQQPLAILDKLIKEQGFGSKNAKTREQSILYITELRAACPTLPLRAWVPILVNALEDSDPVVRDIARESVITIFTAATVGPAAKADLKKELVKNGVRKTTSDIILRRTLGSGIPSSSSSMTGSPPSIHGSLASDSASGGRRTPSFSGRPLPRPSSALGRSPSSGSLPRPSTGTSTGSFKPSRGDRLLKEPKNKTHEELLADLEAVAAANAPPPSTGEANVVKVVYIASVRDLEQEFETMQPCFAGKETEFNWQDREKAIFRIRGMLQGNVHQTYRSVFVPCLKTAMEGILKAINSLRTTLAAAACQLIGELAANLKESLLPLFEPLFAGLLKLASLTKKTIAQTAQDSANIMLKDCPYHPKSLPMLAALLDQKNVAARIYAAQHFKTLIEAQGKKYKEAIETSVNAGLPLLSQMLKKQLADANATVREIARTTFWLVYEIWPETGQTILESVDTAARKGIEKVDNRATRRESSQARSDSLAPARKPAAGRPSIRELISSRRAAQSVAVAASDDLSASTQASANMQGDEDLTAPVDISPSRVHNELQLPVTSSSKQAPSPSLNSNARTPTKRPTSIYGHSSMSHIPSPSRSNQHSPRSRTFSGETGQRRSFSHTYGSPPYQSNGQSIRDGSSTPVQTALPIDQGAEASQMSRNSSRSSSPSLRAPAVENDYSDIEASTFNAMPDGLDSTDDESVNLLNYDATVLHQTGGDITAFDISERSRILDGLMDTTFRMPENTEVEEAVKGLADQAEQTAHRFLELTEFDNDASGGDTTILEQSHADAQNSYPSDIPVPYTPVAHGGQERRTAAAFTVEPAANDTPLLQKLQALHLPDSPMNGSSARPTSAVLTTFAQDEWWISKANLAVSHLQSEPPTESSMSDRLERLTTALEAKTISPENLLELAQISRRLPSPHEKESTDTVNIWVANDRYGRIIGQLSRLLRNPQDEKSSFNCLVALLNLVTQQSYLLNGRELDVLEALFDVSRTLNKNIRTGAECVTLSVVSATEPLYAASCLRLCLDNLQEPTSASEARNEEHETYGWTFAMGLKALGALFSLLPSEVLEEEIVRSRELIKKAINSPQAGLRQTAATMLVKAHQVIQNDNKLFELVDGLTKSQINLCTYLFARTLSNTS